MSYKTSPNNHAEEKIMLARDEKDRLYEPKNKKAIRILTVAMYVLCVSLAAIMLSLYYLFFWDPTTKEYSYKPANCEQVAIKLVNSTKVTPEEFVQMVKKQTENAKKDQPQYDVKELIELPSSVPEKLFELKTKYLVSSSPPPAAKESLLDSMQLDQEMEDTDDGMDFEMEASGQGGGPPPPAASLYNNHILHNETAASAQQLGNENDI